MKKIVQIEIGKIGDDKPLFIARTPNPKDEIFCTTKPDELTNWLLS